MLMFRGLWRILFTIIVVLFFTSYSQNVTAQEVTRKKIAIVIDDFGNNMAGTEEILNLPVPITVAVMPFMPSTKKDAEKAHEKGHDVIVHLPMEAKGTKRGLGPGAITSDLSDEEVRKRVIAAIDNVPHAIGINNHMGSKITADPRIMRIILQVCRERTLIFLDSKTNYWSVVPNVAKKLEVPYAENHIFLDDVNSEIHIAKQCQLILKHLRHHNQCFAIGHVGRPGKKTAAVLHQLIPEIMKEAQFVTLSSLFDELSFIR